MLALLFLAPYRVLPQLKLTAEAKIRHDFMVYFSALVGSVVYFFVVSYSRLRDWAFTSHRWNYTPAHSEWTPQEVGRLNDLRYSLGQDEAVDLLSTNKDLTNLGRPEPKNYLQTIDVGGWFNVTFGLDGLSLTLIRLTAFITPRTILYC